MRPAGKITVEQDGVKKELTGFLKDGINYIQLRDLDEPLGYAKISWDAGRRLPIIKSKEVPK